MRRVSGLAGKSREPSENSLTTDLDYPKLGIRPAKTGYCRGKGQPLFCAGYLK